MLCVRGALCARRLWHDAVLYISGKFGTTYCEDTQFGNRRPPVNRTLVEGTGGRVDQVEE